MKINIQDIIVTDLYQAIKTIKTLDEKQIEIKPNLSNFNYLYANLNMTRDELNNLYNQYESYNRLTIPYIKNIKLKKYIKSII